MPGLWHLRISGLLKYPRSATASSGLQNSLGLPAHIGELRTIRAAVRDFMRHYQMMFCLGGDLNVVADHPGATAARMTVHSDSNQ